MAVGFICATIIEYVMKKALLFLMLVASVVHAYAQDLLIKGKVTDTRGTPLPGASVTIKTTNLSTITDAQGNFQLKPGAITNPVLIVSYIGYTRQEVSAGSGFVNIQLKDESHSLNDIVVVGYGTQRKRDVTGSTSSVKAEEIAKRPLTRVEQALQGTTPGVNVVSNSGQPGTGLSVRIRGANSITGSNEPLYVIDGYIGGNIESISPSDIESLEILKDASATAIYGSRGSNGVVLITTKSGKAGKPRIDFGTWFSKAEIPKKLPLMNAYDFARNVNAQYAAAGQQAGFTDAQLEDLKAHPTGTDWQDAIAQKPWIQNYNLSVSGGSEQVKYLFSFNHLDQPGLIPNSYYKRSTLRANIDAKLNEKLNLKVNITTSLPNSRNNSYAGDITDPFAQAFQWDPTSPIRDANGNYILKSSFGSNQINPVAQANNQEDDNSSTNLTGTGILTWKITPDLTFTTNNTYEIGSGFGQTLYGPQTSLGLVGADYAEIRSSKTRSYQNSNFLTYNKTFGQHSLTVTALYEQHGYTSTNVTARSGNLTSYSLGYYNLGLGQTQKTTSGYVEDALISYMGRVNYAYKDRYLFTASVRTDGSSHLVHKYSTFPSVAVGWNMSRENFLKDSKVISDLKLRGGYGVTGNQAVPAFASIPRILSGTQGPNGTLGYYFDGTKLTIGTPLGAPTDANLKWETDAQTDVGVDAGFFHNRLTISADAYYKKITNLLYNYQSPYYLSGLSYPRNMGSLENKGIELALGGTPVSVGKFKWTSNLTLSFNKNKVLNLGGLDSVVSGNVGSAQSNEVILMVGKPLGAFYGYNYLGTWKTSEAAEAAQFGLKPGDSKYTDVNGDHQYTNADLMYVGNGTPKYSFGFINDVSYGNWTLSFMFQGTHGNQIYSGTLPYTFGGLGDARNATNKAILNAWTPGKETDIPAFSSSSQNFINSSRYVYDASYIKLKNISLTYRFSDVMLSRIKLHTLEVYVSGQNVFTITHYPGYDPEVTNANAGAYPALAQGLETGVIPNPRTYTAGVRIGF
jgi:TonB-dependent starch-binding outer membrane protein SusC